MGVASSLTIWAMTDEFIRLHEEKYAAMNPFFVLFRMQPLGVVATQAMLIDDHEFWESRFYREWCKPQRFYDIDQCSQFCRLTSGSAGGRLTV